MNYTFITWDLGGTKCSAGLIEYHSDTNDFICLKKCTVMLSETTSLDDLATQIEHKLQYEMTNANAICIGAAGQYDGETLHLEGAYPYPMQFARLAKERTWPIFHVIHDYAPIVCATFTSYMQNPDNVLRLNDHPVPAHGRRVAFGIGTGLGLKDGVQFDNGDFWLGCNEVGHIGIPTPPVMNAAERTRHHALMAFLEDGSSTTFEKILSGPGLTRLYRFLHPTETDITPAEVAQKIRTGHAPELHELFAWYTGLFVGTIQLLFMPEGGIWITGGVSLHHLEIFKLPAFMAGIKASPAYETQREKFPLGVLCNQEHALIGCAYYAIHKLLKIKFHHFEQNKIYAIK